MPPLVIKDLLSSLTRRDLLCLAAGGAVSLAVSGWLDALAAAAAAHPQRKRSCILLWMGGGPSQIDTFDLKPGHANGGPFNADYRSPPNFQN
jgi:hypothetical protein